MQMRVVTRSTMIWTVMAVELGVHAGSSHLVPLFMPAARLIWTMMEAAITMATSSHQIASLPWAHTRGAWTAMARVRGHISP
eukprot:735047-Prymnesium_polylepis.1